MDNNAREIVRSLRWLSVETGSLACLGCGHEHNCSIHGCAILRDAADLITQLNDFDQSQSKIALEGCQRAETELAASQRRERAAITDMQAMALAMRESEEMPEECCFACAYDAQNLPDNVILAYGECPGYDTDNCFEWRGPQGAGK